MQQVREKIVDNRMLELLSKFLKAGYIDPKTKKIVRPNIGVPQGGILSPILCNIVMHQFDLYIEKFSQSFEKGKKRRHNPLYQKIERQRRAATTLLERKRLLILLHNTKNGDSFDPNFRRLRYIRYADDFAIMIIGTRNEAEMIKLNCKDILKTKCGVELFEEKTITHMEDNNLKFLGAEITKLKRTATFFKSNKGRSLVVRRPLVKAPIQSLLTKLKTMGYIRQNHKQEYYPKHMGALTNLSHYDILTFYNSKIHGLLNFYSFASNLNKVGRIIWYLQASCALTLARKFKLGTLSKAFSKYGKLLKCPDTGKELYLSKNLKVRHYYQNTRDLILAEKLLWGSLASKLTETKFGKTCTICGSTFDLEMHHVRSVKDIRATFRTGDTSYEKWTAAMKRKQVPLCKYHHDLYKGQLSHADLRQINRYTG